MEANLADDGAEHFLYKTILADFSVIPTVEPGLNPYPTIKETTRSTRLSKDPHGKKQKAMRANLVDI